jgi:DnaK suppressor protein
MATSQKSPTKSKAASSKAAAAPPAKPAVKEKDNKTDKPSVKAAVGTPVKADKAKPEGKPSEKLERAEKVEPKAAAPREEPMTMPRVPSAPVIEESRPLVQTTMPKKQLERFRALLDEKRDDIIKKAKQTLDEDMTLDANDLPDEMDLASSEYLQSFTFRLRGREKSFLDKIEKAIQRIEDGSFGVCEECGEEISIKRLEARPETTLCIRCKEDQERAEKDYG